MVFICGPRQVGKTEKCNKDGICALECPAHVIEWMRYLVKTRPELALPGLGLGSCWAGYVNYAAVQASKSSSWCCSYHSKHKPHGSFRKKTAHHAGLNINCDLVFSIYCMKMGRCVILREYTNHNS